jgi:hypothetical protein
MSRVRPTLHSGFSEPATLPKGMIQNQPPSKMWWSVPSCHCRERPGRSSGVRISS